MLNSLSHLKDARLSATDGDIGRIEEAYIDDRDWTLRYLVVETGSWLEGRPVLISPYAVQQPLAPDNHLRLNLNRHQVRSSPAIDPDQPLSRQHERDYLRHFGYPEYWSGGSLWGMEAFPGSGAEQRRAEREQRANRQMLERDFAPLDVHVRSSRELTGCEVQASDGSIGAVKDFVFDDSNWAIRYLVVDTSAWWQNGHRVLIGMKWAERIDADTQRFQVNLTRAQVRSSPRFEDVASIHRDDEERLHQHYARSGYWD